MTELRRALQDVHVFMQWFSTHGKMGVLGAGLRAPIQDTRAGLERLRHLYREAVKLQSALNLPKGEARLRIEASAEANIKLLKVRLAKRALDENRAWLIAQGVDPVRLNSLNPDELTMPKLEALSDLMGKWFLLNVGSDRNVLDSDFGDMVHLCHAPYVDLIRCDGFAWQASRRVRGKWPGTVFVTKLEELQGAIEACIKS